MEDYAQSIIFEDDALLVLNKPAGVTVNRADTTKGDTIQDWVEEYLHLERPVIEANVLQQSADVENPEGEQIYDPVEAFYNRGGVVHRLDKETSGVLVLAKNPETFSDLQRQFKERETEKTYIALAHGRVTPAEGQIVAPVGRLPWNRKQFGIVAGGRDSVTSYETIAGYVFEQGKGRKEHVSLLSLFPKTGRTHQIRVHLKHIGHPIFADFLYAGRKTARDDRKYVGRVFLHASSLSFVHPRTAKRVSYDAPLPGDLASFIATLDKVE